MSTPLLPSDIEGMAENSKRVNREEAKGAHSSQRIHIEDSVSRQITLEIAIIVVIAVLFRVTLIALHSGVEMPIFRAVLHGKALSNFGYPE
jgi:hypothetical protein